MVLLLVTKKFASRDSNHLAFNGKLFGTPTATTKPRPLTNFSNFISSFGVRLLKYFISKINIFADKFGKQILTPFKTSVGKGLQTLTSFHKLEKMKFDK